MAEPSSGTEEQDVLTQVPRTPARENSPKKKSSNPLTKFLRRKSSRKTDGGEASSPEVLDSETIEEVEEKLEKDPSLVDDVKEVVESAIHDLIHRKKKDSSSHHSSHSRNKSRDDDSSSESSKESKHDYLNKFKDGFGKAKGGLEEKYEKAKHEIDTILHKTKSEEEHHHLEQKPPKPEISTEKKPMVVKAEEEEVKAPNLVQRLQEEVVAVASTIENAVKGETSEEVQTVEKKEEEVKKEDNCITSLAQGLQSFCSWGSKKQD